MKFCTNCGSMLTDDAVFCTVCGLSAKKPEPVASPIPQPVTPTKAPESKIVNVFSFITKLISLWTFFCIIVSMLDCYIYLSTYYTYVSYWPDTGWAGAAIAFGSAALGLGITTFVLTLAKKERGARLFNGISTMFMTMLLFIAAIVAYTI